MGKRIKHLLINIYDYVFIDVATAFSKKKEFERFQMYAIVSVEKMFFYQKPTIINENEARVFIKKGNEKFYFDMSCDTNFYKSPIVGTFPTDKMQINGETISASYMSYLAHDQANEYKIEYIGISDDSSLNRLSSGHVKFNQILADCQARAIDREVYVFLFNAEYIELKDVDMERDLPADPSEEEINDYINEFFFDQSEVTALCEACLINIFKPYYNTEYKYTPSDYKFKTLKDLYDYGYKSVSILVNGIREEYNNPVVFYTDTLKVVLNEHNSFRHVFECPFDINSDSTINFDDKK